MNLKRNVFSAGLRSDSRLSLMWVSGNPDLSSTCVYGSLSGSSQGEKLCFCHDQIKSQTVRPTAARPGVSGRTDYPCDRFTLDN